MYNTTPSAIAVNHNVMVVSIMCFLAKHIVRLAFKRHEATNQTPRDAANTPNVACAKVANTKISPKLTCTELK